MAAAMAADAAEMERLAEEKEAARQKEFRIRMDELRAREEAREKAYEEAILRARQNAMNQTSASSATKIVLVATPARGTKEHKKRQTSDSSSPADRDEQQQQAKRNKLREKQRQYYHNPKQVEKRRLKKEEAARQAQARVAKMEAERVVHEEKQKELRSDRFSTGENLFFCESCHATIWEKDLDPFDGMNRDTGTFACPNVYCTGTLEHDANGNHLMCGDQLNSWSRRWDSTLWNDSPEEM